MTPNYEKCPTTGEYWGVVVENGTELYRTATKSLDASVALRRAKNYIQQELSKRLAKADRNRTRARRHLLKSAKWEGSEVRTPKGRGIVVRKSKLTTEVQLRSGVTQVFLNGQISRVW